MRGDPTGTMPKQILTVLEPNPCRRSRRTAQQFVEAAVAAGIPRGDYNGRDRGGAAGFVSLTQTTTRGGKRSSTYVAFLAGEPENRSNLTIITGALVRRNSLQRRDRTNHGYRRPCLYTTAMSGKRPLMCTRVFWNDRFLAKRKHWRLTRSRR